MFTSDQYKILERFAELSDQLFEVDVISTDSFTGEIGEYLACSHFHLKKIARVTEAIDGVCSLGKKYQVKSKVFSKNSSLFRVDKLMPKLFDYLILVFLDTSYNPIKIIRVSSKFILNDKFSLTASNIYNFEYIDKTNIYIQPRIKILLNEFASTVQLLKNEKIIRSSKIVGDIGEFYASKRLDLNLSCKMNEKGIDATNISGLTFEIKTRRVYDSGRRKSETRRLNGLVGKRAKYLIVVTLDRAFN